MAIFLRAPHNYDTREASKEAAIHCPGGRTIQSQKQDADINEIVRRFGLTGELPHSVRTPQYGDFTGVTDYQTALNAVKEAEMAFMTLPAHIRARFNHDPQQLLEWAADPKNAKELKTLGLKDDSQAPAEDGAGGTPPSTSGGTPVTPQG